MDVEKEKTQTDPETNVYYVCTCTCMYTLYTFIHHIQPLAYTAFIGSMSLDK